MNHFKNITRHIINIGGHTVIAPTQSAALDPEVRGIKDLIDRNMLEEVDAPPGAPAGQTAQVAGKEKEPSTINELKAWLNDVGATYPSTANKAELQGLYESLKEKPTEE